ncbi:hypothetical protein GOV11_00500 [Candidatus Woesearchaeota archaeon]|nr:hypothetical protein [Candidatus Woesearchaeota archaeon]
MAIPKGDLEKALKMLDASARPIYFHDDDPDGIASFVILYQHRNEGKVVTVKSSPVLGDMYLRKIDEFQPDLIVVLDKPMIAEEFLDNVQTPILWLDHHEPQLELLKRYPNVTYLNPRIADDEDNRPTSYWAYKMTGKNLWLATVGCVGDWYMPDFMGEFAENYADLLPKKYDKVEDLYLDTPIGELIRILQFNLKGTTTDVRKSVLTLTRIESPYEILHQSTSRGRFLWKKYRQLADQYDRMLASAREWADSHPGKTLFYIYEHDQQTFTAELSNELLIRYPERVILVGRHHDGKYKCSIRSKDIPIPKKLESALEGLEGYGGGHTHACGCVVDEDNWEEFKSRLEDSISR